MIEIAPSILSANFVALEKDIKPIANSFKYLHIDVMDGHFVPNITIGAPVVASIVKTLKNIGNFIYDTHLMIENPDFFIPAFAEAGSDIITVHQEATKHLDRTVSLIKSFGKKAGVSLNPATDVNTLKYILPQLDLILIMSVNPGFGGQSFIPYSLHKIKELKAMCENFGVNPIIQVDGGVSEKNIKTIKEAGANVFVVGSALFNSEDRLKQIELLKKSAE